MMWIVSRAAPGYHIKLSEDLHALKLVNSQLAAIRGHLITE